MKIQMTHKKTGESFLVGPFPKAVGWTENWDERRMQEEAWKNAMEDRLVDETDRPSDYTYSMIKGDQHS